MSLCDPCGRTFIETAQLLNLLKGAPGLTHEVRLQMEIVRSSLRSTGNYLITKEIIALGHGRPHYKEQS